MSTNLTVEKLLPPFSTEGIDLEFIDQTQVEDDYNCNICLRLMYTPTETPCSHTYCKQCITNWLQRDSICPLCRHDVKTYELHTSTYLQRKIGQLYVQCEFKCGISVQWQHYMQHRYTDCKIAKLLQHYIEFCSGTVDDTVINDIAHVNDISIKLLMYIADRLKLDRSNCIEKSDLSKLLFNYAEQQHSIATQHQYSKTDPMYDYTDWSIKQLKTALKQKHVTNVDSILERSELEALCRQNFIIQKPPVNQPTAEPVKPANYTTANGNANNTNRNTRNTFNVNNTQQSRSNNQSHSYHSTQRSNDNKCTIQ